jgi:serine-type D-Ala-D-Ala carboxypeptidase (penicillin-binding protein 5/6)
MVALPAPLAVAAAVWLALVTADDRQVVEAHARVTAGGGLSASAKPVGRGPNPQRAAATRGVDAFSVNFAQPPKAGLVFDVDTGEVLWRRNPLTTLPIASVTKVMTALVATAHTHPDDKARITNTALVFKGNGLGLFKHGTRVRIKALLEALLIPSDADAANALAVHVAGSIPAFARMMNQRAEQLGLKCTHFVSPHGYESANRSCAADLAALARLAMRNKVIRDIVRRSSAAPVAPVKGTGSRFYVYTTNPLLRDGFPGTIGLKTGFTQHAGRCLIAIVRRGRRTYGVVLLHSPNPGLQAEQLINEAVKSR